MTFRDAHENLRSMVCLGGGHGLFQTLRAARTLEVPTITAVVTVADDGGSSGRIRRELGQIPPGDLRMAMMITGACGNTPSSTASVGTGRWRAMRWAIC